MLLLVGFIILRLRYRYPLTLVQYSSFLYNKKYRTFIFFANELKSSHVVFLYKKVMDECIKLLKFAISCSKQNCSLLTAAILHYTEIPASYPGAICAVL